MREVTVSRVAISTNSADCSEFAFIEEFFGGEKMKVYNVIPVEIKIADYSIFGISLGDTGRGRKPVTVPTPEKFEFLEPGTTKTGKPRLNNSSDNTGWIVRISSEGAYVRGANGNISVPTHLTTSFSLIAKGWGAFGDAGRIGTWDDVLFSTTLEEFLVRVKPSRGDAYLIYFSQGKATKLSFDQADSLELAYGDSSSSSRGEYFTRL